MTKKEESTLNSCKNSANEKFIVKINNSVPIGTLLIFGGFSYIYALKFFIVFLIFPLAIKATEPAAPSISPT